MDAVCPYSHADHYAAMNIFDDSIFMYVMGDVILYYSGNIYYIKYDKKTCTCEKPLRIPIIYTNGGYAALPFDKLVYIDPIPCKYKTKSTLFPLSMVIISVPEIGNILRLTLGSVQHYIYFEECTVTIINGYLCELSNGRVIGGFTGLNKELILIDTTGHLVPHVKISPEGFENDKMKVVIKNDIGTFISKTGGNTKAAIRGIHT